MPIKCPKCQMDNPSDSKFCKECATPLPFPVDLSVTKTLETPAKGLALGSTFAGRYQIVQELGRGGMGAVYKALDTQINEEVAIKLIRPEIAADEKTLERFGNELKLARKISHKNVCRMYHLEKGEETPYISMEYLEGEDLKKLIRTKERLPAEEAIGIAQQMCEGLVEAHRLGVVHRDLKPQNIMIGKDGEAKIMDFGIARSLEAPGVTQTGVIIGTPDYISPEQAEGLEADHRSDIYSLGVILYEMVTGSVPFKGDTALSVALKHKAQLPLDPRKRNPELSDDLGRLILICMEKDRARRYQTAKDLLDDLRNIEQGLPLGTKIRPHRATAISKLLHSKWFIPAVVILVAAIIGIVLWRIIPSQSPVSNLSGIPSIAVLDFQNRTGDKDLNLNSDNLSLWVMSDLAQSRYLTVVPDDKVYEILSELDLIDAERLTTKDLRDIARMAEASHILRGAVTRSGDSFRIDTTLQETDGMKIVGTAWVEGADETSFTVLVDQLTQRIKANLDLSETKIAGDFDEEVGTILTKSPEALKFYREGRRYYFSDPEKSADLMKKAVEIDPGFAMAYRSLALVYFNRLGDRPLGDKYWQKMMEFIDRISQQERMLILAQDSRTPPEKRIEILEELLKIYPQSSLGRATLGTYYLRWEYLEKAAEQFEIGIQYRNAENIGILYSQLQGTYLGMGEYGKIEELVEKYKKEIGGKDDYSVWLGYAYAAQGKKDLALREQRKRKELPKDPVTLRFIGWLYTALDDEAGAENAYRRIFDMQNQGQHWEAWKYLGDLSCLKGRFNKAEEQYWEGLRLAEKFRYPGVMVLFHEHLADLAWRRGDIDKALEEIEINIENIENSGDEYSSVYFGVPILAAAKRFEEAQKIVEVRKKWMDSSQIDDQKNLTREYFLAEGHLALGKGDYAQAISHFEKAQSLLAFPFPDNMEGYARYFEALALAYYRSGDLERAQEEYKKISEMTLGRVSGKDIYAKSFYMLGKIAEQRGWPGKAIEHYEKFLELWKDADPDIPEIEDAKIRLETLK
jgi:serine/threonine protein kinase